LINGLDLFSGIGGLSLALEPWVRTLAYCEANAYAQSVLLSRMRGGALHRAPIWDDVRTLRRADLLTLGHGADFDIIFGGFPCQDLSLAGDGAGLAGERSGLVFEILRLVGELEPSFVFLENVPALRSRGADAIVGRLAGLGYECRWDVLSAFDVGAPHLRERWWLLAYRDGARCRKLAQRYGAEPESRWQLGGDADGLRHSLPDADRGGVRHAQQRTAWRWDDLRDRWRPELSDDGEAEPLADAEGERRRSRLQLGQPARQPDPFERSWWEAEPPVGRVVDGLPGRVDRLRSLGNSVVPSQAREAFVRLMGLRR
jgi:DNA (cytosine-5)-methyltransferase 1